MFIQKHEFALETVVTYAHAYSFRYCILSISINLHLTPKLIDEKKGKSGQYQDTMERY